MSNSERDPVRAALADAIDSPTVAALENVFNGPGVLGKSYSEMIVEILAPQLNRHLPGRFDCGGALKSLSNEISGWLSAYEPDLRAAMGNTNFAVMEHKLAEANVALLKTDVEYRRGYAAGVADQIETQEYERNIAEALPPTLNSGAVRAETISECIGELELRYPDHAWLNAACAALRGLYALALPRAVDGGAAGEREAAIHDALLGLIEAVELDSDTGGKGISGYTAARLHDARETLSAFPRSDGKTP